MALLFRSLSAPLALMLVPTAQAQDTPAAPETAAPASSMAGGIAEYGSLAAVIAEAGYPANPDADGDFPVGVTFEDGRSQSGWVLNGQLDVMGMVVREVRSVAAILPKPLSKKTMARLLVENAQTVGAWQVYPNDKDTYVVYSMHVPADADAKTLNAAIAVVLSWADQEEAILTGADVH